MCWNNVKKLNCLIVSFKAATTPPECLKSGCVHIKKSDGLREVSYSQPLGFVRKNVNTLPDCSRQKSELAGWVETLRILSELTCRYSSERVTPHMSYYKSEGYYYNKSLIK